MDADSIRIHDVHDIESPADRLRRLYGPPGPPLWAVLPLLDELPDAAPDTQRQYRGAVRLFACFDRGLGPKARPKYGPTATLDGARLAQESDASETGPTASIPIASAAARTGTTDTGARLIDSDLLKKFFDWMVANGYEGSTCNKTWRFLRPIFRKLAPPGDRNGAGLGIIDRIPHVKRRKETTPKKKLVRLDRLDSLYFAAGDMTWPADKLVGPATAWRALLVLIYNAGPRTWTDAARLPLGAVCLDHECPDPQIDLECETGWLDFEPVKTERYERRITVPMTPTLRRYLEPLATRQADSTRERLFPFGNTKRPFYDAWGALCELAALERFDMSDLRKTCGSAWNRLGRGKLGPWVLGHAAKGTHDTFYNNVLPELIAGAAELPQPAAFATLLGQPIERQRRLF